MRTLIGGVALLVSGFAQAATPAAGTLSADDTVLTYSSGPFVGTNPSVQQNAENPECLLPAGVCDDFALTVDLPADYTATHPRDLINIRTQWAFNQAGYFIYLLDDAGTVLAYSLFEGDPNALSVPAVPGNYTVRLVPATGTGDVLATTISLMPDATAPAAGDAPTYTALVPPAGLGDNLNGEMNIGFNPGSGRILTLSYTQTLRTSFGDDGTVTWNDVSEPNTQQNTNDPILFTDALTGRTFVSQLQAGTPGQSIFYYSDDDGDTWTLSPATLSGGIDHQTVGGGPYSAGGSAGPAGSYPNAVYYCSQSILVAFCIRSDDGGATFGVPAVLKTVGDCDAFLGGLHGHVKVAPDGTVHVPDRNCGGVPADIVSEDSGDTFSVRRLPAPATGGAGDPSIGIASDGTTYLCYLAADSHIRVAVSRDKGQTWINDRDIGYAAGVQHAVFAVATAGDPDRAACGFLGTATRGNYQSASFEGIWHPYVATTYDGGDTWHTVNATPGDPVQGIGGICLGGTTCLSNRNLLDFNDMTLDDTGRVLFGYNDGCVDDCVLPPHQPTQVCIPTGGINDICLNSVAKSSIVMQTGGRTLYAAFDNQKLAPVNPSPPARSVAPPAESRGLLLGAFGFYLLLPLLGFALARR